MTMRIAILNLKALRVNVKHNWEEINQGIKGISNYGKRQCEICGAVQVKESIHVWMRVVGYRWFPLIGRCKGIKINT